jgi:hypothetical protein
MSNPVGIPRALSDAQVQRFIHEGFVRIDHAFPRRLAAEAQAILWSDTGCDPHAPTTWTKPVIRLGMYSQRPFVEAANTAVLHAAFDQLVGAGRWLPCTSVGTFPVRFPSPVDPGDAGWHIDMSFGWETPDFMDWRANITSKGRALLMLMLFSDVGESDAPTRIRVGSHHDAARMLAPAGEHGLTTREMVSNGIGKSAGRPEVLVVGDAGTVYLCHPFLVHAAQSHRGTRPRFLAQPPLLPREGALNLARSETETSPVEAAIRLALSGRPADS